MLILKKTKTPRDIVEIISRKPQKTFCKKRLEIELKPWINGTGTFYE